MCFLFDEYINNKITTIKNKYYTVGAFIVVLGNNYFCVSRELVSRWNQG